MKKVIRLMILLALVRSTLYALIVPPWQSPDAPGHFEYVALIAMWDRVPASDEYHVALVQEINASLREQRFEWFHPMIIEAAENQSPPALVGPREVGVQGPLYYALLAPFYRLTQSQPILVRYYVLVMVSGVMAALTVLLAAQTACTLFPDDQKFQFAISLPVLFWPTQSYMAATVNNDNLATLFAAWCLLGVAHLFRYGPRWPSLFILLTGVPMAIYTKRSVFFLVPLGLAVGVAYASLHVLGKLTQPQQRVAKFVAMSVIGVLLISPLILLSPGATAVLARWMARLPIDGAPFIGDALISIAALISQREYPDLNWPSMTRTLQSLWATYGWGSLYQSWAYWPAAVAVGVAVFGVLWSVWQVSARNGRLQTWQKMILISFVLCALLAWFPIVIKMVVNPFGVGGWPGRYLMTLLIPMSTFLALGLQQLAPRSYQAVWMNLMLAALILFDAVSVALTIIPRYYG